MALCPAECVDFDLIPNPIGGCSDGTLRERRISRIAFMKCDIELPSEYTALTVAPLFATETQSIFLSQPLANITVNDPEFEDVKIHDCVPLQQIITRRTIDFQDRLQVTIPAVEGPPAVPANPFGDYALWQNKLDHRLYLRYGFVYCNGDFVLAKDKNGNLLEGWFNVFLAYENIANDTKTIEFKKGTLSFLADPLALYNTPEFNLNDLGISA